MELLPFIKLPYHQNLKNNEGFEDVPEVTLDEVRMISKDMKNNEILLQENYSAMQH